MMDNRTIHTGEEGEKAIKIKEAKLIYLSPYSPDFSPIKNLGSKLKNILRSIKTTKYQELAKAIEFAFNEATERKYLELIYSLLLLYLIFMRKAILRYTPKEESIELFIMTFITLLKKVN